MPNSFTDQLGNQINLSTPPRRIISLVPSQTELLFDLGLEKEVVGITKFCIHPEKWRKEKTIVGGTKNFDFDVIAKLQPDLIIGNKEENYLEGIKQLQQSYPVWMSDITTVADSFAMIHAIGLLTQRASKAEELNANIQQGFSQSLLFNKEKVLYLIWRDPWMAAGKDTFINTLLEAIGLVNSVTDTRYPHMSVEELQNLQPDFVFLSSEPYPFKKKHLTECQHFFPKATVVLVNGEMFSWYGSRLLLAPSYFQHLHKQLKANAT